MSILDRALRVGEGKKFKQFEKQVERINDFEPELELESEDESSASAYDALRERAANGESLDDLLSETFALTREAGRRTLGHAPLRRPADRRHGAARRLDRRDEDRRGQDAHRHAAAVGSLERARRRARASTS